MERMSKRERLEAAVAGDVVDRPPVALWRHWPGDDRTPDGLAAATIRFQQEFDFDFVKVTPASSFCVQDWGARDEWRGNVEGTRVYTGYPVQEPEDWAELPLLDPEHGALGDQLTCLQTLQEEFGEEVPFIQTVFNPLSQAKNLAGQERLLLHLRRHPGALQQGLETIAETTVRFIEAARARGVAGIFYAVQHARYELLSEEEYRAFGRTIDLRVLEAAQSLWLNVLHLHGAPVMFDLLVDYPVQVINWHDRETAPSLAEGKERFAGAVCGGLARWETVVRGSPEKVRAEAVDALIQTEGQRFVLGTGCVVPVVAPTGNLRAARQVVEAYPEMGSRIAAAIWAHLDREDMLSCAAAFRVARELETAPLQVGETADAMGVRLNRCQLGLFGYGPKAEGRHKVVEPAKSVDEALERAIHDRLAEGKLSCKAAWEIAAALRIPKMAVSAAAETLGIKIVNCQLGAF